MQQFDRFSRNDPRPSAQFSNIYCPGCGGKSTKHEIKGSSYSCLGCGSLKAPYKRPAPNPTRPQVEPGQTMKAQFEHRIKIALGLLKEEGDSPVTYVPDGKKKKTSSGAHRFDDGVDFYQMKNDMTWKHKEVEDSIK